MVRRKPQKLLRRGWRVGTNSADVEADRSPWTAVSLWMSERAESSIAAAGKAFAYFRARNTQNRLFFLSYFTCKDVWRKKRQLRKAIYSQRSLIRVKSHIFISAHFLKHNVRAECRACRPRLCLGSRRGGKETRARSLRAPTAGFNSPPSEAG